MPDVQFEDDNIGLKSRRIFGEPTTPKMIVAVMNTLGIKNVKFAGNLLIVLSIIILIISVYLVNKAIKENSNPTIENNLSKETIESLPLEIRMKLEK